MRVMRKLRISEISGVDEPKNKGTRVTLLKRATPDHGTPEGIAQMLRAEKALAARADALLKAGRIPPPGSLKEQDMEALREEGRRMREKFETEDDEDEEQEADMTKDVTVDTDALAEAIAITKGCDLATAYKSIAVAERVGEEAVQALFSADVQAALGVNTADIEKAVDERADEIRKSGDWRARKVAGQKALREQLYESPEEFGYR